jgi:23S rRNA pseudouridine2457 synthase
LDKDSEGLLLLTTDGKLSNAISKGGLDKEYYVQVDGNITESALAHLRQGVTISNKNVAYTTKPCKAHKLEQIPEFSERGKKIRDERHGPSTWISIVINEGKFRQVRKMTASVGFPTLRLVRVRIGNIHLEQMQTAEVLPLEQLV